MRLFVDDIRVAPEGWVLSRTITEAIRILATQKVEEVSLDHDIAYMDERGKFSGKCSQENYSAVAWYIREIPLDHRPRRVYVHTANPDGFRNIESILKGYTDVIRDASYASEWFALPTRREDYLA